MKMTLLKRLMLFVLPFSISLGVQAQQAMGTWKSYMAYHNATLVAETPNKVFAVYEGSLLSYSPEDEETKLYSKADGLNDVNINHLGYNVETKTLVITYQSGNVDILTNDGIYNLPFIKEKPSLSDKSINNLEFEGKYAYLSTGFGVVKIDLERKEIKATYQLDKSTLSVCTFKEYIYAATNQGLFRALTSSVLEDKSNWVPYILDPNNPEFDKNILQLLVFKDRLVYRKEGAVFYIDEQSKFNEIEWAYCKQITVLHDQLILVQYQNSKLEKYNNIAFYSDFKNKTVLSNIAANYISSLKSKTTFWLAQGNTGLTSIEKQEGSSDYTVTQSGILVDSPLRNLTYKLRFTANKLLVTGGGRNARGNPGTLMVYENEKWTNFDTALIAQKTGFACQAFMDVAVDPQDPNHYFVTSWGEGVYEFKDNQFVTLYNHKNSSLSYAIENNPNPEHYIFTDGIAFDKDNNLYILNSEVKEEIKIYAANKQWLSRYYTPLPSGLEVILNDILITKTQKWINLPRATKGGLFVLEDQGTLDESDDKDSKFSASFVDPEGKSISGITSFMCMAEDLNGAIWVGTDIGPIVFSNPKQAYDDGFKTCVRPKIPRNDGSELADYLLEGQRITAIAVDGGNRKWMGTDGAGVFLVSSSGDEVLENFTTENSNLISDKINSIAINGETGEVFFATDAGLVSYKGDAITGKPNYSNVYAFPNPVRPEYNSLVTVTGLMSNSTVKITDLNGNLVNQGNSVGGQYTWDCRNKAGSPVKSGVYLVFSSVSVNDSKTESVVTKIVIIR